MKWPFWPIGFWKVEVSLKDFFFLLFLVIAFFIFPTPNITLLPGTLWDRTTVSIKYVVYSFNFWEKTKRAWKTDYVHLGFEKQVHKIWFSFSTSEENYWPLLSMWHWNTGTPPIGRFLGLRKNRLNRKPSYWRSFYGINS